MYSWLLFERLEADVTGQAGNRAVVASPAPRRTARFEVLDSFRGIAALLVVLFHLRVGNQLLQSGFIHGSYLFVDFFFVLSGFVIARNYLDRISDADSFNAFLVRRFFRLLPLHLFVTAIYLLFEIMQLLRGTSFGEISGRTAEDLFRTLFLTNSFGMDHDTIWNPPSWSISAEWWTYVVFGLLVLLLGSGARLRAGLLLLALLGVGVVAATSDYMGRAVSDYGIFRCFYGFGLGGLVAAFWPRIVVRMEHVSAWKFGLAEFLLLLAIVWFVSTFRTSPVSFAAPLLFVLVILVFAWERGPVSRLLRGPLFLRAGLLSYSIYMMHQLVIGRVRNATDMLGRLSGVDIETAWPFYQPLRIGVILVAVWVVSGLTWRFVEVPGQALGVHVLARWRRRKETV